MQYNRKLQISTAGTRKAMHWPKSEIMWSEFAEKLKTPKRGRSRARTGRPVVSLTCRTSARLGVVPPTMRSAQSSSRSAPPR